MDSIQMKIAKTAANNWGDKEPTTLEESLGITWDSEVAAVEGITKALNLDESTVEKLVGTKAENGEWNRDGEIYTSDTISQEVASQIKGAIESQDKNGSILDILSTIHDAWVRKNPNNFLKEGRNKERQFVPLQLLDWGEVESDLLFLKPILEAAGINVDEKELREAHETKRDKYLKENHLFSKQDIIKHISKGSKVYPALEGLTTKNQDGKTIDELLENKDVSEKMGDQIVGRLIKDVLESENQKYKETYWVRTKSDLNLDTPGAKENGLHEYDQPMTFAEIKVRELLGENIRSGFTHRDYGTYENEISTPAGEEWHAIDLIEGKLRNEYKDYKISIGGTEIDSKFFFEAGMNPEKIGLGTKEKGNVSPKNIAEASQQYATEKGEVSGIKGLFAKLFNKNDREKGE